MSKSANTDFLVIGGGVIGLRIAIRLKELFPSESVCLIEKEEDFGAHASGRNSGVLHAGFYYSPDSLKARFTREGNRRLTADCLERKIPILQCGKLVVTRNEEEVRVLEELYSRGLKNGVELTMIDDREAERLEPQARTFQKAILSPTTSSVNPKDVVNAYVQEARERGVTLLPGTQYLGREGKVVRTETGRISFGFLFNAAGLYADRIARDFGLSQRYRILPFKGLYLVGTKPSPALNMHLYPVPDIANPFLGVHFTRTIDGKVKIGPTAIPAFWRENYTFSQKFHWGEFAEIVGTELGVFLRNDFGFRSLAMSELPKFSKGHMVRLASGMVKTIDSKNFMTWGKPGIRAQLFDLVKRKLVMDFCFEQNAESLHILNAVSPAFTCAIPFAEHVIDQWRMNPGKTLSSGGSQ